MADISLFLGGWAYKSHELAQINIPYERKKLKMKKTLNKSVVKV